MKTYKQFRKTFEVLDVPTNEYIRYIISIGYKEDNGFVIKYQKLYEGKSLVMNNRTTIDFTSVINNSIYRQNIGFNSITQSNSIIPMWENKNIKSEEYNNSDLVNTLIKVDLYYQDELLNSFKYEFSIFEVEEQQPYTNFIIPQVKDYNNSIIKNNIPYIKSDNYFITVPLVSYNTAIPSLKTEATPNLNLTNGICGNYIINIPLLTLYNELENVSNDTINTFIFSDESDLIINGGNAIGGSYTKDFLPLNAEIEAGDILAEGNNLFLSYEDNTINKIATIDTCYNDWYLSWLDFKGWHSVVLNNVEIVNDIQHIRLKNIYQEEITIKTKNTQSFKIKSQKLTNEELEEYNNMLYAQFVVLYNTKTDNVYYCNVQNTNTSFIRNNNVKFFEAEIKTITHLNF